MVHLTSEATEAPVSQESSACSSPLDPVFKSNWLAALRSDEYEQARHTIGNVAAKKLCCLGVGAVVANPSITLGCTDNAVEELRKHGFPAWDANDYSTVTQRLIDMNDNEGSPFPVIADFIEANL